MIVLFGATNDSWLDRRIGQVQFDGFTQEDLHAVLPAYCHMAAYVTQHNPQARVLCVINDIIKPEIRAGMLAAARHVHAEPVELADIDRACGHPTRLGMRRIAKQIARALELAPGGAP